MMVWQPFYKHGDSCIFCKPNRRGALGWPPCFSRPAAEKLAARGRFMQSISAFQTVRLGCRRNSKFNLYSTGILAIRKGTKACHLCRSPLKKFQHCCQLIYRLFKRFTNLTLSDFHVFRDALSKISRISSLGDLIPFVNSLGIADCNACRKSSRLG